MKKNTFLFLFISCIYSYSQRANDCVDAFLVCGNTFVSSNVSGFGIQELDASQNACGSEETNSVWLRLTIAESGSLAFTIRPNNTDLEVDYDFYVFGPNSNCTGFNDPIRCNTTNPIAASLSNNLTGLRDSERRTTGGPIKDGNGFVASIPVTAGEQYHILVDRPVGNGGFHLEWTGTAGFISPPQVNDPEDIEVCYDVTNLQIDLTEQEAQINTDINNTISYYTNYENAFDLENKILDPSQFMYMGNEIEIYIRVENPNGCFEIVDFKIKPFNFEPISTLEITSCDSDRNGTEDFSVNQIREEIENKFGTRAEFNFSLHNTEDDANNNRTPISQASITRPTSKIYARISSKRIPNCSTIQPLDLIVLDAPYPAVINLVQCDVDELNSLDGITRINLEQTFLGENNVEISYYQSINDRNANRPINTPQDYTNQIPFNDRVYYRVVSQTCETTGEIALEINPTVISLNTTSPIMVCAENDNSSISKGIFNLENIRQASYAGLDVTFYANRTDLSLEQNPLEGNLISSSKTLFVRIETSNQCQGVEEIELLVNPIPNIELEESYQVCTDGQPLIIQAPNNFDSYKWYNLDTSPPTEIANTPQVSISESGNYQLEVSTNYETNGQSNTCFASSDFIVTASNRAIIENIKIQDASDVNSFEVFVRGDGDYEFSIDNQNYQNESFFENAPAGFFTVYVRDKKGCGISQEDIAIIGFPKFFTPNGDGVNDIWQIIGVNEELLNTSINIYDRYGKLLQQFRARDLGWNGTFQGRKAPAADYWFTINFLDREKFRGHFTLKR